MRRARPCSHTFLAFILKFLNFLQTFIGASIILYSWYLLNQWNNNNKNINPSHDDDHDHDQPQPPYALLASWPSFGPNSFSLSYNNLGAIALYAFNHGVRLPAPWFIYAFMSLGIILCCVTCIGHIAAEAINGCCLCFYTFLSSILILTESAFVAFVALDRHWEKDLPFDPTGELDHFRNFIEENLEISKWVGIFVLIIQALSLFISLILRAMVSAYYSNIDIEGDYEYDLSRGKAREPLLNPQLNPQLNQSSDTWSSRMRKKYRLDSSGTSHNPLC